MGLQVCRYFPKNPTDLTYPTDGQEQRKEFNSLVELLKDKFPQLISSDDKKGNTRNAAALAFLVEVTKQIEPTAWKDRLNGIKEHLKREEIVEASWYIQQLVWGSYNNVLYKKGPEYSRLLDVAAGNARFEATLHKNNKVVGFSAISPEFIPSWHISSAS